MPASCAPRPAPRRRESPCVFQWCLLGVFVVAVGFLLSTSSDACELPPPFEAMDPVGETKEYYEVGEKIRYRCKRGYLHLLPFLTVTTCEPNHTWVPISDDACVRVQCPILDNPEFGKAEYIDHGFAWGQRVKFSCSPGYYLSDKAILLCELIAHDDAAWNGNPPRCEKIFCSSPPKVINGTHTFSKKEVFEYRDTVTYSCDPLPGPDQYSLVGAKEVYCANNNTWSSPPPECKVVKCPHPNVKNGKQISGFADKYNYEATVMFECIGGFYMVGSDTAVCMANNSWEPPMPKCLKGPKPTHPKKPPVYKYPEGCYESDTDSTAPNTNILLWGRYESDTDSMAPNNNNNIQGFVSGLCSIPLVCMSVLITVPLFGLLQLCRYPNPNEGIFDQELDRRLIVLIALTSVVGLIVIGLLVYRWFQRRKKGKTEVGKHKIFWKKTSIPVRQTP